MKTWSKFIVVALASCLGALVAGAPAHAAEITVVAGGGPLPDVLGTLMPMFEKATGNKVKLAFKGGPETTADLKAGAADLVITNSEVVDELARDRARPGDAQAIAQDGCRRLDGVRHLFHRFERHAGSPSIVAGRAAGYF